MVGSPQGWRSWARRLKPRALAVLPLRERSGGAGAPLEPLGLCSR